MIRKDDLLVRIIECENQIEFLEQDNEALTKKIKKLEKAVKDLSKDEG
jgi:cell division protein FtsB